MEFKLKDNKKVPKLGDVRRVPSYAYPNWGLNEGLWKKESEEAYETEWKSGSPRQMQYVVEAITRSGLGNFSQMLRDINADVITYLISKAKERVNYLEIGAGVSTVNVYQKLKKNKLDLEKIYTTMVEPSKSRIECAAEELSKMGLKKEINFKLFVSKDTDVNKCVDQNSQDIIGSVAQIHHHSYWRETIQVLYETLNKNGIILISDWHNSLWEHPARVYNALKEDYNWETKDEDLKNFVTTYPKAIKNAEEFNSLNIEANRMIREFWKSYGEIRSEAIISGAFDERDELLMLEGHRPVERYVEDMKNVNFSVENEIIKEIQEACYLNGNPHQLLPLSRILMLTIGTKIE